MTAILAFAGSARAASVNKQLVALAAAAARDAGAEVTLLDPADQRLPLYDGDLEERQGLPPEVVALKQLMRAHDGFLIACPEYNSSITPLLKNMIDWASRAAPGEPPLVCFRGKTAALLAASPGNLGGLRGLVHVRAILGNIGVFVVPGQVALPAAHEAFAADGSLLDARAAQRVRDLAAELVDTTRRLRR